MPCLLCPQVVRYVVGNTLVGVYKGDGGWDVWIDTQAIPDLYQIKVTDAAIEFGANISLYSLIETFKQVSSTSGFEHLAVMADHLLKVANTSVRNFACWAGNLMIKHTHPEFPSDVFVIMCTCKAMITVMNQSSQQSVSPEVFLNTDMTRRLILKVKLPSLHSSQGFVSHVRSYKVMPRSQNVHSYVSAGFSIQVDPSDNTVVDLPSIVYAGVSSSLVHATRAENYLLRKSLSDTVVVGKVFGILSEELKPDTGQLLPSSDYIKSTAINLFYRYILSVLGDKVPARLQSGASSLERGLNSGQQDYDTDPKLYPITQPMAKITAINQTSGEAQYTPDIPPCPGQLYASFAISKQGNAGIASIDPSKALSQPGVVRYISIADIPKGGVNNFQPPSITHIPEEIFASSRSEYAGQPVGLIVADSQHHAVKASRMVQINYKDTQKPVTDIKEAIAKNMFYPRPDPADMMMGDAEKAIGQSKHTLQGRSAKESTADKPNKSYYT